MRWYLVTLALSTEVQKERIAKLQTKQTVAVSPPNPLPPGDQTPGTAVITGRHNSGWCKHHPRLALALTAPSAPGAGACPRIAVASDPAQAHPVPFPVPLDRSDSDSRRSCLRSPPGAGHRPAQVLRRSSPLPRPSHPSHPASCGARSSIVANAERLRAETGCAPRQTAGVSKQPRAHRKSTLVI